MTKPLVALQSRVSLREVREESYRALRAVGYSWGQAQVAGRLAGMAQVLWGTGIQALVHDGQRLLASRRLPKSKQQGSGSEIATRGTQFTTYGPLAMGLCLGKKDAEVLIRGGAATKEFATALWDLQEQARKDIYWGVQKEQFVGFSVRSGDLIQHGDPNTLKTERWLLRVGEISGGQPLMDSQRRAELMDNSLRTGVAVDPQQWTTLKKISWKFLVPE